MKTLGIRVAQMFYALSLIGTASFASLEPGEPTFCDPNTFQNFEIETAPVNGLVRNHAFQLGNIVLIGLAVGKSDVRATQTLSAQFDQFAPQEKNCTWYFNDGNPEAEKAFHHRYVSNPSGKGTDAANEFERVLSSSFSQDPVSFASCMMRHGYVAMGCDGQKHRGPSVFAMLLSYVGCSPKNATAIANKIWGTNGVAVATREAIANKGRLLGNANPEVRKQIRTVMGF